jgi:hypothetical protein
VIAGVGAADRLRSRGSIASRSPSPRRLKPSVASTTASPGNTIAPGCTVTDCCSPSSMRPHDGVDTGVRPRYDSAASASTASAAMSDSCTISTGAMFGTMWRRTVRSVDEPLAWAAAM